MSDLFDSDIGLQPATRSLIEPRYWFENWWRSYKCLAKRKVSKPWCEAFWIRNELAKSATQIMLYTAWRFEHEDVNFMPGPKPFLNAWGWLEWTPEPPKEDAYTRTLREAAERSKGTKPPNAQIREKMKQLGAKA